TRCRRARDRGSAARRAGPRTPSPPPRSASRATSQPSESHSQPCAKRFQPACQIRFAGSGSVNGLPTRADMTGIAMSTASVMTRRPMLAVAGLAGALLTSLSEYAPGGGLEFVLFVACGFGLSLAAYFWVFGGVRSIGKAFGLSAASMAAGVGSIVATGY